MSDDFETTSGVTNAPSTEAATETPKSASAKVDENTEASEALDQNDNAEGDEAQDEGQTAEDGDPQEGDRRPKKNGFKKRIDGLNRKISEKDREIEHWKKEALKANGQQSDQPKQEAQTQAKEGKPDPKNFDTNAEYIDALTDWKIEQKEKASKQAAAESDIKNAQTKLQTEHNSRIEKFKETNSDYDAKVAEFIEEHGDIEIAPIVAEAIQTSELGPDIVYAIINTPGEYQRLQNMNAVNALKEIGKLEAKLAQAKESSASPKPIKKTTTAPKPMNPVGTPSKTEKSLEEMDFDEFMEARNKKGR